MMELSPFELLKRQPKAPPHVARVVVQRDVANKHGAMITYIVKVSRKGNEWWLSASLDGFRMSNTLHTTVRKKAESWIAAVTTGQIGIKEDDIP